MITMQHARLAVKMEDARDTMRRFWGDRYPDKIAPFRDAIQRWRKETGKSTMEVGLTVCELTEKHGDPMDLALAFAAIVEECEADGGRCA